MYESTYYRKLGSNSLNGNKLADVLVEPGLPTTEELLEELKEYQEEPRITDPERMAWWIEGVLEQIRTGSPMGKKLVDALRTMGFEYRGGYDHIIGEARTDPQAKIIPGGLTPWERIEDWARRRGSRRLGNRARASQDELADILRDKDFAP